MLVVCETEHQEMGIQALTLFQKAWHTTFGFGANECQMVENWQNPHIDFNISVNRTFMSFSAFVEGLWPFITQRRTWNTSSGFGTIESQ